MTEKKSAELLKKASESQRLTKEEETALSVKIMAGDSKALDKLVKANMWLVEWIIRKGFSSYASDPSLKEDLESAGYEGLVRAAWKYDGSANNNKFSAYAGYSIWGAVCREIRKSRLIIIPEKKNSEIIHLKRLESEFEKNGLKCSDSDLAVRMGTSVPRIKELKRIDSMNSFCPDSLENDEFEWGYDFRADVENRMLLEKLLPFVRCLSGRKYKAVTLCFGLEGENCHKKTEVAEILGITKQAAGQLIKSALDELSLKAA